MQSSSSSSSFSSQEQLEKSCSTKKFTIPRRDETGLVQPTNEQVKEVEEFSNDRMLYLHQEWTDRNLGYTLTQFLSVRNPLLDERFALLLICYQTFLK